MSFQLYEEDPLWIPCWTEVGVVRVAPVVRIIVPHGSLNWIYSTPLIIINEHIDRAAHMLPTHSKLVSYCCIIYARQLSKLSTYYSYFS